MAVAGVVGAHGGVAALQFVEDLVHDVGLDQGLLLDEQVHRLGDLGRVSGVLGVAQVLQGDADGVPGVVEHQDLAGVSFSSQSTLPAVEVTSSSMVVL